MSSVSLNPATWCVGLLLATGSAAQSQAAGTCTGTIETALLHPLPRPMVVMSARSMSDSPGGEMTRRFMEGLQEAGVTVGDEGNVTLNLATSVTAPLNGSNVVSGRYEGFNWVSGDPMAAARRIPGLPSTNLSMSAVLADNVANTQSWLATIDCQVQTDDPGALAKDLGVFIGRAVGSNQQRKRI